MTMVNMDDAKSRLSKLVSAVENKKERIVLCRGGEPIAEIIPFKRSRRRLIPDPKLRVKLNYDPTGPLTEDEVPREYR
jgi:antitoxin (DNA-binding transcriptional repressor) of toxin-antitoxin stability system